MTRRPELDDTVSFGEAAAIGRIERALFGGDAELVRIGRYEILERIGSGAFGRVYRAKDPQLDRTIALKVLDVDGASGFAHDDLLGEAKVMATIGHPNVAAVFDAGVLADTTPTRVFIAMELVVGHNLRAWLATPRTVPAILDAMRQVGHGLIAAHAAGVVHRDVKPENILVGDDGRVRVVDFGLARAAPGARPADGETDVTATTRGGVAGTAAIAGTPAYMAPELFEGAPASTASDLFAYCVTIWEALYGARPFAGTTLDALRTALAQPLADPPRKQRGISRTVTRSLGRGLARDPSARQPSIAALLDDLDRGRSRRRVLVVGLAATTALGAGIGIVATRSPEAPAAVCPRATVELVNVWDGPRQAAIADAFRAIGDDRAAASFARVAELLDHQTTRWLDARADACAATHVRHEQSPQLLDKRMACLREWRRQLVALSDRFVKATPVLVGTATRAIAELPPLERCASPQELDGQPTRPTEPGIAAKLDALDDRLADARVQFFVGEPQQALATAEAVSGEAAALGYEPTQIAALLWEGEALIATGRYADARTAARQCFDLALAIRDHRTAALAAAVIAFTGAYDSSIAADALAWIKTGESLRTKLDFADDVAANLAHVEGNIYLTAADPVRAKPALERAIAAWKAIGTEHPNLTSSIAMLGIAEMNLGDVEGAHQHLVEAVRLAERDLGPDHPELAASIINLGLVQLARGDYTDAARSIDRGLDIQVKTLGAEHPLVGYARLDRGQVAVALGDIARADQELTGAQAIAAASYGATHPITVTIALASGEHYARTGRGELAREQAESALAATAPTDHGPRALGQATLALAASTRHDRAGALAAARDAQASLELAANATGPQRVIVNDLVGETLLAAGLHAEGVAALRVADATTGGPPDPLRRARVRFALARATGDRAAARRLLGELPAAIDPALRAAIAQLAK